MAVLAADLIVTIRGDNRQFVRSTKEASDAVNGLGGFLNRAAANAVGWIAASTIIHAVAAAFNFAKEAVVDFNGFMEQNTVAFKRMTGSAENATNILNELYRFASETPFEVEGVVETTRNFMAIGLQMNQIRPLLSAIADGVAYVGKGSVEIDRVRIALVQMANRGKVATQEMNQLNEAGLTGMWQILAGHLGVTTSKLQKMVEDGLVPAEEFFIAFIKYAQSNWGGAAAEQAQTFNGAITTVRDNVKQAIGQGFQPLFDILRDITVRFANFTKTAEFGSWAQITRASVQMVIEALGVLVSVFGTVFSAILTIVTTIGKAIYESLQYLNPFATFSPSLVSQVEDGTARILDSYGELGTRVPQQLESAKNAVDRFKEAAGPGIAHAMQQADNSLRKTLSYLGSGAAQAYFEARDAVKELEDSMKQLDRVIQDEEDVLKGLEKELDNLTRIADEHKKRVRELETAYDSAEKKLNEFLNAPLKGQAAFENAMFASEKATKSLELAIVNLKLGGGLDRAKEKVDKVRDSLRDAQERLRDFSNASLVGSKKYRDALQANTEQTNKLKLQLVDLKMKGTLSNPDDEAARLAQIDAIESALDDLGMAADKIRLEEQVDLGPARYQLEELVNTTKEMTFEEAKNGIIKSQHEVTKYQDELVKAEKSLDRQEKAMRKLEKELEKIRLQAEKTELERWLSTADQLKELQDLVKTTKELTFEEARAGIIEQLAKMKEIGSQLDVEKGLLKEAEDAVDAQNLKIDLQREKLDVLKDKYQEIKDQVAVMNTGLKEAVDLANQLKSAAEAAAKAAGDVGRGFDISKLPTDIGGPEIPFQEVKFPFETFAKIRENLETFKKVADEAKNSINGWRDGVVNGVNEVERVTKPVLEKIKSYLSSVFSNKDFTDSVDDWGKTVEKGLKFGLSKGDEFNKGFIDGFNKMFPNAQSSWEAFTVRVSSIIDRLTPAFNVVVGSIIALLAMLSANMQGFGSFVGAFAGLVVSYWLGIGNTVASFVENVIGFLESLFKFINEDKTVEKMSDGWNNATKNIAGFADWVVKSVTGFLNSLFTMIKEDHTVEKMTTGWDNATKSIAGFTDVMVKALLGLLFNGPLSLYEKSIEGWNAIISSVYNLITGENSLKSNAVKGIASVVVAIMSLLSTDPDSLFNRISSLFNSIINTVWNLLVGTGEGSLKAAVTDGFWRVVEAIFNGPMKGLEDRLTKPFRDALKFIKDLLAHWPSVPKAPDTPSDGGSSPQPEQHGGMVRAGRSYVVGEKRAELFVPGMSGRIYPSVPQTASYGDSGPGVMHLTVMLDSRVIANAVAPVIVGEIRARTGIKV